MHVIRSLSEAGTLKSELWLWKIVEGYMKSLGRYFEIRVSRHSYLGITALPTRKKEMFEPANVTNF